MLVTKIRNIADAIRERIGTEDKMTLEEMPDLVRSITGGGGDDPGGGGGSSVKRVDLVGDYETPLQLKFQNNTIYQIDCYRKVELIPPAGDFSAYFYINLPWSYDDVEIIVPDHVIKAGDRLDEAKAGDIWEISFDSSYGCLSLNVRSLIYE